MRLAAVSIWLGGSRVQAADATVVGKAVRAWATVLRCEVAEADMGGGWTMMAGADGTGGVHACVGPMSSSRAGCGDLSSDPMR
jgi:hypothetical protein